ncbi:hypothetical protein V6N12_069824 [Hibiscus sabdariffa]|uniref:Transmembrane protein n=1 Tax=Hibiscus sabdariffa TaxID=183260 RepID=A0ABR2FF31_9ROSI
MSSIIFTDVDAPNELILSHSRSWSHHFIDAEPSPLHDSLSSMPERVQCQPLTFIPLMSMVFFTCILHWALLVVSFVTMPVIHLLVSINMLVFPPRFKPSFGCL